MKVLKVKVWIEEDSTSEEYIKLFEVGIPQENLEPNKEYTCPVYWELSCKDKLQEIFKVCSLAMENNQVDETND